MLYIVPEHACTLHMHFGGQWSTPPTGPKPLGLPLYVLPLLCYWSNFRDKFGFKGQSSCPVSQLHDCSKSGQFVLLVLVAMTLAVS